MNCTRCSSRRVASLRLKPKFDQYARDIPYATLAQAFQTLIRHILSRSDDEFTRWRDDIREAVGPNGQLIVNLIPEMELLIGKQPPVPELAPQDAQNRFQMVFRRLLSAYSLDREHPLVLFLDDLQWLDAATLTLLADLVTRPGGGLAPAGRRVPGQRSKSLSPPHEVAGDDSQGRSPRARHSTGPPRSQ